MGGVQRYVYYLVPALIRNAPRHEFFLYADTKAPLDIAAWPANATVRYLPWQHPLSSISNDLFMWHAMQPDKLDLAHFPGNYGFAPDKIPLVITLHDEINILPWREIIRGHPKRLDVMAKMTYLHWCSARSLQRVKLILTVSNYARQNIIRRGKVAPEIIQAVHSGLPDDLRRVEDAARLEAVRRRHGLTRPFILGDALKNAGLTVQAWSLLPPDIRERLQMVFYCRTPNIPEPVQAAANAGCARVLVRPPTDDLIALYSMAEAFIFPSWIEGFGFPVLEAMACGAPVIASNRGSIPEVAGEAALLVNAEDAPGLARLMTRVLSDSAEAERLRQRGYQRAAQFSWDHTARRVLELYEQVVTNNRGIHD
jgi:glycosyltransferase involved in cell wall biosynthesis